MGVAHEWKARMAKRESQSSLRRLPPHILHRSRDLRHPLPPPEARLWRRLRDHQLGLHIRRQHVLLGRFIADFYCAKCRLCIEIDGDTHCEADQAEYDAARTAWLEEHGIHVIRFTNSEVMRNLASVLEGIQRACQTE